MSASPEFRNGLDPDVEGPPSVRERFRAVPDPPERGPLGRLTRRLVQELLLLYIHVNLAGRRFGAWLLRTEYKIEGACHKRGVCCQYILLEWTPFLDRSPFWQRVVLWKHTRLYDFFDRGYTWEVDDGLMTRVLGCHALQTDGTCGNYRRRPLLCRVYPEAPLVGRPMLHKGCGFYGVRRDGAPDVEEPRLVQLGGLRAK